MSTDESVLSRAVVEVKQLLAEDTEWIDRYDAYAHLLLERRDSLMMLSRQFNRYAPLQFYISVSQAKASLATLTIDVRYLGQTVANLLSKQNGVFISTKSYAEVNKKYFGYNKVLEKNTPWHDRNDKRAAEFRAYFKSEPPRLDGGKGNEEHNVESLLISEFEKESSDGKHLLGIQPMKYASKKLRFSMPTPISASNHGKIRYSGPYGGGVDILARTGRGYDTRLCVIEVKDENVATEPPAAALEQAVAYAVFLRELLRSKAGDKWWRIFGYRRSLPHALTINASIAMPYDGARHITDFANTRLPIGEDFIECHYIYFTRDDKGQIADMESSLRQFWQH